MGLREIKHRIREREWMDAPDANEQDLRDSLHFIRKINHYLGYNRATISHLERFSANWPRNQTIRILDVATGSADVPREILRWADVKGLNIEITAIDLHEKTLDDARALSTRADLEKRLTIMQADAMNLPFENNSFDYAITSMFLHHLDEPQIVRVLQEMNRVARRGLIVADLLRDRTAIFWIKIFTLFSNPMVRHDAIVSVRQSLTENEIESLARDAGIDYLHFYKHFAHRWIMAGEKQYK